MTCMGLRPTCVLMTGHTRVRIANMGVSHIVDGEARGITLADHKREDIISLSKLLIMFGTMSLHGLQNLASSVKILESRYSPDFCKFALLPFRRACNAYDMLALSYKGLLNEVDMLYSHSDSLEEHLASQFESDRMFRLLAKLGLINERPDGISAAGGNSWSETGDRYILKLFRDFVFHQTDDNGRAKIDFGHIAECLNKLDVGSDETILLASRDEKSVFVVTYLEVRRACEAAFAELCR